MNPARIVLSGVAINTILMGFTTLLQLIYSDSLSGVLAFLNGSISASTWYDVRLILAKALQAKFNVPYLELNFYGYQACLNSSEQIAKLLELNIKSSFREKFDSRCARLKMLPYYIRQTSKPLLIYSVAREEVNLGLAEALKPFGLEFAAQLDLTASEEERIAACQTWHDALVFADEETLDLLDASNEKVLISFPWYHTSIYAEHLPFMGLRGMDYILEKVMHYTAKHFIF